MMYFIACSSSFTCISANKTNSEPGNGQVDAGNPDLFSRATGQPRHGRIHGGRRSYHHLTRPATRPTPPSPRTTEPHARVARHKWPENEGIVAIPRPGSPCLHSVSSVDAPPSGG